LQSGAAGKFLDRLAMADPVGGANGVDGSAAVGAGPTAPTFDAAPVDTDGDRGMRVVVVRGGAVPSGSSAERGGRSGEFVEQYAKVRSSEKFIAVEPTHLGDHGLVGVAERRLGR
jgi:hypothetical protein